MIVCCVWRLQFAPETNLRVPHCTSPFPYFICDPSPRNLALYTCKHMFIVTYHVTIYIIHIMFWKPDFYSLPVDHIPRPSTVQFRYLNTLSCIFNPIKFAALFNERIIATTFPWLHSVRFKINQLGFYNIMLSAMDLILII